MSDDPRTDHTPGPWQWRQTRSGTGGGASGYLSGWRLGGVDAGTRVLMADHVSIADSRLLAAAPALLAAVEADLAWWDFENAGCPYPDGMSRDSAGGERIWRAWYDQCLAMCARAVEMKREALALVRNGDGL